MYDCMKWPLYLNEERSGGRGEGGVIDHYFNPTPDPVTLPTWEAIFVGSPIQGFFLEFDASITILHSLNNVIAEKIK